MRRSIMIFKSRARVFLACVLYIAAKVLPAHWQRNNAGKTRVLVFHHIDDPARFRSILAALCRNYQVLSFDQYLAGEVSAERINVVLALDDGYSSWFGTALPLFREYGIRPLLFINSDFVGLDEEVAKEYCRRAITTWPEAGLAWDEVRALEEAGAEIGGHSQGHVNLVTCESTERIEAVVHNDRLAIGHALGHPIRSFAYPFGRYDDRAAVATAKAGYSFGFTSDSGFLDDSEGPLLLKRSNIGLRPSLVVCAMVEGWPDFVSEIVRRLKRKSARK
jgi:peptidoglycan/xylan/chitin deacetylase (PgdA/CDA1 family)